MQARAPLELARGHRTTRQTNRSVAAAVAAPSNQGRTPPGSDRHAGQQQCERDVESRPGYVPMSSTMRGRQSDHEHRYPGQEQGMRLPRRAARPSVVDCRYSAASPTRRFRLRPRRFLHPVETPSSRSTNRCAEQFPATPATSILPCLAFRFPRRWTRSCEAPRSGGDRDAAAGRVAHSVPEPGTTGRTAGVLLNMEDTPPEARASCGAIRGWQ